MFAVIKTGGKQYRVQPDDVIKIERLDGEAGADVSFDQVLMVGDDTETKIGDPLVDGASVTGTVLEQARGPKIIIFKKKRRKHHRRRNGHRQDLTVVRITDIAAAGAKKKAAPAKAAEDKSKADAKVDADTAKPKAAAKAAAKPKAAAGDSKPKAKADDAAAKDDS
jgi:large subunit ribosomal protein L21